MKNRANSTPLVLFYLLILTITQQLHAQEYAYITNTDDNTITVIDLSTNAVIKTTFAGNYPMATAFDKYGKKVYITNYGSDKVRVLSTSTNDFAFSIEVGNGPIGITIGSKKAYVANNLDNSISVIDLESKTVEATISVGDHPFALTLSPDESILYVCNGHDNTINIINTETNTITSTVQGGNGPGTIIFSSDGTRVYIGSFSSEDIYVMNSSDGEILSVIPLEYRVYDMAFNETTNRMYTTDYLEEGHVTVINTETETIESFIEVGCVPAGIELSDDGAYLYVVNNDDDNLNVISTLTEEIIATIPVGGEPLGLGDLTCTFVPPPGDTCNHPIDISELFGYGPNEAIISDVYCNNAATVAINEPDTGFDCFLETSSTVSSINNSVWFTFRGDGNTYRIQTIDCDTDDYIDDGNTQAALYIGDSCNNLTPVLCVDDQSADDFSVGFDLVTEAETNYFLMIDGYLDTEQQLLSDGEFCIEVARYPNEDEVLEVTFQVDASSLMASGELAADGLYIAGTFNNFTNASMNEGNDNIWTLTLPVTLGEHEYKFKNGQDEWEEIDTSISEDCTTGENSNRFVFVENMGTILDPVCFGYCVPCTFVGAKETILDNGIRIYPNPAGENLNIDINLIQQADQLNIHLINTLGQTMSEYYLGTYQSGSLALNLTQIPSGLYLLQIEDGPVQFISHFIVRK